MVSVLVSRTESFVPTGDLLDLLPTSEGCAWLHDGEGAVAWGEAARFEIGSGEDRFERAAGWLNDLFGSAEIEDPFGVPGSGPIAFASFSFDPTSPASVLIVPEFVFSIRDGRAWTTRSGMDGVPDQELERVPVAPTDKIRYAGSSIDEVAWLEAVDAAIGEITAGRIDKVVLARDLKVWSKSPFDQRALTGRLSERYPECYTFAVDGFLGATPELLLGRTGENVASLVLAGTAPRSADDAEDRAIGERLLASPKDAGEHRLSVESVRSLLGSFCNTLTENASPSLLKLANVQHLATWIQGTLRDEVGTLEMIARLHPTAAVCGTPRDDALDLIRKLEGLDRGRYAGPVGWIDARGDGEFGIGLRCAEVSGTRARLFAGAGLVEGSVPEAELDETRLKLRAMRAALGDLP
ncbi:MAG: isochorismate synthase [Actinobacteria bacterium]|nr:isochorismate synthase [Actinomycetota bacterium]